ncbi:hypothetical protein GJ654_04455 [Rhodoblastus acidophilus]|uniref:Multidrug transporter n=1 Tax=Rhodoblastus acidophilus TaxID=1074 RepID=A0A6N8DM35_RHOAC|nr:hypothetical protein [Rhodoblastus acidophilus]MCW2273678.1 hypothetical protein [Rhodoblastus acidophilus]MTV30241.1 hypothetical protein [Rhodoblastus acidophilus]
MPAGVAAIVIVDDDDQERGGIVAETPAETDDQPQVRAYGLIKPLDGLTNLFNATGAAKQQLKAAEIRFEAARAAAARARDLQKVMPSAASQAETAEAALKLEGAGVETAREQLRALRTQAIQDWGARLGEEAASQSALAEDLVLRKAMLVQLTLPADLPPPPRLALTLGGEPVEARLLSPATQADSRLAGPGFFYVMPAISAALTGASVVAALPKGAPRRAVAIKASAVVWQSGKPWIYVKSGPDRFERRGLGEGATPTPDGGYALPSWPKGRALVVEGAQALLSQEAKAQKRADEDDD